jgi:hypothetical protein
MNRLHLRYFVMSVVLTFIASVVVGGLIISLMSIATGAAYIAGWWTNLAMSGAVAILAGRKVASIYEEPRQGRVAGGAVGLWVGAGAALGQLVFTLFVDSVYKADVKTGLMIVFMLVSFAISVIASTIAGREAAHPPEEEEA